MFFFLHFFGINTERIFVSRKVVPHVVEKRKTKRFLRRRSVVDKKKFAALSVAPRKSFTFKLVPIWIEKVLCELLLFNSTSIRYMSTLKLISLIGVIVWHVVWSVLEPAKLSERRSRLSIVCWRTGKLRQHRGGVFFKVSFMQGLNLISITFHVVGLYLSYAPAPTVDNIAESGSGEIFHRFLKASTVREIHFGCFHKVFFLCFQHLFHKF